MQGWGGQQNKDGTSQKEGISLFNLFDFTFTSNGRKTLTKIFKAPLRNLEKIEARRLSILALELIDADNSHAMAQIKKLVRKLNFERPLVKQKKEAIVTAGKHKTTKQWIELRDCLKAFVEVKKLTGDSLESLSIRTDVEFLSKAELI